MVKALVQTMVELWYGPYENFINAIKEQNEEKALRKNSIKLMIMATQF